MYIQKILRAYFSFSLEEKALLHEHEFIINKVLKIIFPIECFSDSYMHSRRNRIYAFQFKF